EGAQAGQLVAELRTPYRGWDARSSTAHKPRRIPRCMQPHGPQAKNSPRRALRPRQLLRPHDPTLRVIPKGEALNHPSDESPSDKHLRPRSELGLRDLE